MVNNASGESVMRKHHEWIPWSQEFFSIEILSVEMKLIIHSYERRSKPLWTNSLTIRGSKHHRKFIWVVNSVRSKHLCTLVEVATELSWKIWIVLLRNTLGFMPNMCSLSSMVCLHPSMFLIIGIFSGGHWISNSIVRYYDSDDGSLSVYPWDVNEHQ